MRNELKEKSIRRWWFKRMTKRILMSCESKCHAAICTMSHAQRNPVLLTTPFASVISFSAGNVFKGKGGPGSHILSLYIRSHTQRISPCLSRKTTNTLVCLLSCHTSQQSEALKKNVAKTGVAQFKTGHACPDRFAFQLKDQ